MKATNILTFTALVGVAFASAVPPPTDQAAARDVHPVKAAGKRVHVDSSLVSGREGNVARQSEDFTSGPWKRDGDFTSGPWKREGSEDVEARDGDFSGTPWRRGEDFTSGPWKREDGEEVVARSDDGTGTYSGPGWRRQGRSGKARLERGDDSDAFGSGPWRK